MNLERSRGFLSSLYLALLVVFLTMPSVGFELGPASIRLQDIGLVLILGLVFVFEEELRIPKASFKLVSPLILLLLYSLAIGIYFDTISVNTLLEFIDLSEIIIGFLIIPLILLRNSIDVSSTILAWTFYITIVGSILGIAQFLVIGGRFVSVPYVVGMSSLSIYYGISRYLRDQETLVLLGTIIILCRIILSQTRSIWIFLPLSGFLAWIIFSDTTNFRSGVVETAKISAPPMILLLALPLVRTRLLSVVKGSQFLFARVVVFYTAVSISIEHPFGVGLGNYTTYASEMVTTGAIKFDSPIMSVLRERTVSHVSGNIAGGTVGPHSDFFKFLAETGVIGALLYTVFIVYVLRLLMSKRNSEYPIVLKAAIIYLIFSSLASQHLLAGGGMQYVVLTSILIANESE